MKNHNDIVHPRDRTMNPVKMSKKFRDKFRFRDEYALKLAKKKIEGAIGKKWDDIRKKIKGELPERLHHYIDMYIHTNCIEEDGEVLDTEGKSLEYSYKKVYVGKGGIIKSFPPKSSAKRPQNPPLFISFDNKFYSRDGEIWFELKFKSWDEIQKETLKTPRDYFFKAPMSKNDAEYHWGAPIICCQRIQCGKNLIKKLNEKAKVGV